MLPADNVESWCRELIVKKAGSIYDAYAATINMLHMAAYRKDDEHFAFLEEAADLLERWHKVQAEEIMND